MNTDRRARNDVRTCDLWFNHGMAFAGDEGDQHGLPTPHGGTWQMIDPEDFPLIHLYACGRTIPTLDEHDESFRGAVTRAGLDTDDDRARRLASASPFPRRMLVVTPVFDRNPDVVTEVLRRAGGTCEACKTLAPFKRKSDGSPYLEVHHIKTLTDGGEDTVKNAQALCPNCHRKAHYGQ